MPTINFSKAVDALYDNADAYWNKRAEPPRWRLSPSMIGHPCERKLWYDIRGAKNTDGVAPRIRKLFNVGSREETVFVRELENLPGAMVITEDEETGNQLFLFAKAVSHFNGNCDGVAMGLPELPADMPVLLEMKTMSQKAFDAVKKNGVHKEYPIYVAQMQSYMGMHRERKFPEMELCLFMAVNKNSSELYYEYVQFNQNIYDGLTEKALRILRAKTPPPKISETAAWWECKLCEHADVCHDEAISAVNCRSCVHAFAAKNAKWKCRRFDEVLSEDKQRIGCDDHLFIPEMLPFKLINVSDDFSAIEYQHNGKSFKNAIASKKESDCFTSSELATENSKNVITDEFIKNLKEEFPGTKLINEPL